MHYLLFFTSTTGNILITWLELHILSMLVIWKKQLKLILWNFGDTSTLNVSWNNEMWEKWINDNAICDFFDEFFQTTYNLKMCLFNLLKGQIFLMYLNLKYRKSSYNNTLITLRFITIQDLITSQHRLLNCASCSLANHLLIHLICHLELWKSSFISRFSSLVIGKIFCIIVV